MGDTSVTTYEPIGDRVLVEVTKTREFPIVVPRAIGGVHVERYIVAGGNIAGVERRNGALDL